MKYGSVCSGIEAATVAWHPLGWEPQFFSEIEAFPSAVLAHHYHSNMPGKPLGNGVPNHGDMLNFQDWPDHAIELLVGGTPCQDFSVAGLRAGLAAPRGNLTLTYLGVVARYEPRWVVWENVPGVLSVDGGRAFGAFLGGLAELGYGFAYRVLDAQFVRASGLAYAVPQRRRRVFVVGYFGDWRRAAAVLFDGASLRGDSPPRREAGQNVAPTISARTKGGGGLGTDFDLDGGLIDTPAISVTLTARDRKGPLPEADLSTVIVSHALRAEGFDASEDGTGRGTPLVPIAFHGTQDPDISGDVAHPLGRNQGQETAIALPADWKVRRLTPVECHRLQGFPDDYLGQVIHRGKPPADGPQYKALGNSMAVNVMRVIGERIAMVDALAGD
ncbi:MAG: DNA cytosine methyltransferase [Burkholderiaceae bacterium]|nr:DNA cytosine methyltransferase [Burkholderiaceae bacterium]